MINDHSLAPNQKTNNVRVSSAWFQSPNYFHYAPWSCYYSHTFVIKQKLITAGVNVIQIVAMLLEGKTQEGLYNCSVDSEIHPSSEYLRGLILCWLGAYRVIWMFSSDGWKKKKKKPRNYSIPEVLMEEFDWHAFLLLLLLLLSRFSRVRLCATP